MMELVSQVLSTGVTAMTIVDSEEEALWPVFVFSVGWFRNVKDY
jgi:hypothetical protein